MPITPSGNPPGLGVSVVDSGMATIVVSNATVTGTARGYQFTVAPRRDGGDRTLSFSAQGIGAIPTAVTIDLESNSDGLLVNFNEYGAAGTGLVLVAASEPTDQQVKNVTAGNVYLVNITTLTLGGATGVNIILTVN
jgi:hypothetical protein